MPKDKIYLKISNYLKQAIANGDMKLGEAIYSENRLCEMFKVSRTSVRRAIREMIEENILECRQGKGTFVRGLGPSLSICLLNHYTRYLRYNRINTYYPDIIFSAERTAAENNCRMLISSKPLLSAEEVPSHLRMLHADGFLLDGAFQDQIDENITSAIRQFTRSCVVIDGNPEESSLPAVSPDWECGYDMLFQKIPCSGKRILFINNAALARNRWAEICFKRSMQKAGLSADFMDYSENVSQSILNSIEHEYILSPKLEQMFSTQKYDIVFCANDHLAMNVINFFNRNNISVPGDVKVFGLGGFECGQAVKPALSTLKVFSGEMAARAAELLLDLMKKKQPAQRMLLPVQLFLRESFQ